MGKPEDAKKWLWHQWLNKYQGNLFRLKYRRGVYKAKIELINQIGTSTYFKAWKRFIAIHQDLHKEYGDRVKKGRLEAFAETGTEGFCWSVYEDGKTGYEGLNPVGKLDRLIIFNHDGSIAFGGVIDPDFKVGYKPFPMNPDHGQPCAFGCWIHWTQRGWDVEDWARLFMRTMLSDSPDKVPLRAIIVKRR